MLKELSSSAPHQGVAGVECAKYTGNEAKLEATAEVGNTETTFPEWAIQQGLGGAAGHLEGDCKCVVDCSLKWWEGGSGRWHCF